MRFRSLAVAVCTLAHAPLLGAEECVDNGNPPRTVIAPMPPPSCGRGLGTLLDDYTDANGERRYACFQEPAVASIPEAGLPLVVYLHPSLFDPDTVYVTNIPAALDTADLTGDGRKGFLLLSPQGRNTTHFYPAPDDEGEGWDNWHRPSDPSDNVDVAAIDHYIAAAVSTGKVDRSRIFLTGWSNGAAMAIYYAHVRPKRVTAAAVYSAPNPYGDAGDPCPAKLRRICAGDECRSRPPLMVLHNNCDVIGICQSGTTLARQLSRRGFPVDFLLLDSALQPAAECVAQCAWSGPPDDHSELGVGGDSTLGLANHLRWPMTWTPAMFRFFQTHPKRAP